LFGAQPLFGLGEQLVDVLQPQPVTARPGWQAARTLCQDRCPPRRKPHWPGGWSEVSRCSLPAAAGGCPIIKRSGRPSTGPNPSATEAGYGDSVPTAVGTEIASACLIRPGATTHSLDTEQRLVNLPIQLAGPEAVLLQMPATATIAPPGWYLLFVVTGTGIPSEGSWIHLTQTAHGAPHGRHSANSPKTAVASK
jgi:Galactose oxidase-like, Early set domain